MKKIVVVLGALFIAACSTTPDVNDEVFAYSKYSKVLCSKEGFLGCLSLSSRQCKGIVLIVSKSCKVKVIEDTKHIKDTNSREKISSQKYAKCLIKAQVNTSIILGNKINYQCMNNEIDLWGK